MRFFKNKWTPLFLSNFWGVLNDNFLKNCIIFVGVGWSSPSWLSQSQLISLVSASLIIPYLLLSPYAGRLSVKFSKLKIFRFFKLIEFPIIIIAIIAFHQEWIFIAIISVLLMGIQSCLYSPSKYSLIRDIGGEEGVSFGSGIFEAMAFAGILLGTILASIISDNYQFASTAVILVSLATLGYYSVKKIKAVELPGSESLIRTMNPVIYFYRSYHFAKKYPLINSAILGSSVFWLIGGMLQMNIVIHCKNVYHASNTATGLTMAFAAIGIALGSWGAGKASGHLVKKGFILIGLCGICFFLGIITFIPISYFTFSAMIMLTAFSGGFLQVPCLAMIQKENLGRELGDMIAYLNLATFVFVLAGTGLFSMTTYLTNDNSFIVFGTILMVAALLFFYFIRKSPVFRTETIQIIRNFKRQRK